MLPGLLVGGGQENGRRAGTENVPYIVGLGCAAELRCVPSTLTRNHLHLEALRTALLQTLHDELGASNVHVHGPTDPTERLPNTLSVALGGGGEDTQNDSSNDGTTSTRIPLVSSGQLLQAVRTTVAASAGAACHSTGSAVSSILQAMGMPDAVARATVRLSVGPDMTMDQVERAGRLLAAEVRRQSKN